MKKIYENLPCVQHNPHIQHSQLVHVLPKIHPFMRKNINEICILQFPIIFKILPYLI